jgi:hypothetical protein
MPAPADNLVGMCAGRAVEARATLSSLLWSIEGRKEQEARRPKTSVRFAASKYKARSIDRAQILLDSHQKDALRTGAVVSAALEFSSSAGTALEQPGRVGPSLSAPRAPPALIPEFEPDAHLFQNTLGGNPRKFESGIHIVYWNSTLCLSIR